MVVCRGVGRIRRLTGGRRELFAGLGLAFATLAAVRPASARGDRQIVTTQDDPEWHQRHMAEAFEQRRRAVEWGDQPFGAVVVRHGVVVGEGPSRVVANGDPTAHAEMEAVRDACQRLGTRDLSECELYATSQPCRMCEAAASWAGVARVYYGSGAVDAGAPRLSRC